MNQTDGSLHRRRIPDQMAITPWIAPSGWEHRSFSVFPETGSEGSLLFLGGRGDFFEKYLEAFEHWRDAGWSVSGFDWRGQGGSGRLHPGGACHIDDFATFVADLEAYCADWQSSSSGPHVAVGHSMGGHILLRAALYGLIEVDGLILLSPMLGIRAGLLRGKALGHLASIGRLAPLRMHPIWSGARSPNPNGVTSCPERQADKLWWKGRRPELGRSGPTWGWLAAATRSIAELDRSLGKRKLTTPGLLLSAADDPIVDPQAIRRASRLLPTFDYRLIGGAGHELLRERDCPREEAMSHIAAFLYRIAARA